MSIELHVSRSHYRNLNRRAGLLRSYGIDTSLSQPQIPAEEATGRGADQDKDLHPVRVGVFSRDN